MPYCAEADIIALELEEKDLISLTDDVRQGVVDSTKVTAAIKRADAEINKYCGSRYSVPFSTVPDLIQGWSCTLAAFFLYRNRQKPPTLVDRYNKVMHDLGEIRDGNLLLPGATESASASGLPASTTEGQGHEFTRSTFDTDGAMTESGTTEIW